MKIRTTVILCIVAVICVIAAMLVERARPAGAVVRSHEPRPLLAAGLLPVDDVDRITIRRGDEDALVFVREGDRWRQVEPVAHPMEAHSMRQLVTVAASLTVEPGSPEPGSEAVLGLDPPEAQLTFQWPDGELSMALGRRAIAGRAYLKIGGEDRIFVVNHDLHQRAVEMDDKEWRDRTIFRDVGIDSDRIEILGGEDIVLVRERKQWKMEQPVHTRLDELASDELFQALGGAKSAGFILDRPDDLAGFGLAQPAGSVAITTTRAVQRQGEIAHEEDTQRLLIGARIGVGSQDRFAVMEGRPVVFRLPEAALAALFRRPADLVARTASGANPADVKSIRIDGPGGDFEFQRDLERWIAPAFPDREPPLETVDSLLQTLTALHATAIEIAPYPHDMAVATITLFGFDGRPMDTVRIARATGETGEGGAWALENGDGVLRIHPASLEMPLSPADFGLPAMDP